MRRSLLVVSLLSLAAPAVAPRAQSIVGVTGPSALVVDIAGPAHGSCAYPDDALTAWEFYPQGIACSSSTFPLPFVPGVTTGALAGDVAVDRVKDRVYVTDGTAIGAYDATTGAMLANFTAASTGLATPFTGLGWDGERGWLWISNITSYAAVEPDGACLPILRVSATSKPIGLGLISDIDFDPHSGNLWICTDSGTVAYFPEGAILANDMFVVAGPQSCGELLLPLTGLCLDTSGPHGSFVVTDGVRIVRLRKTGPGVLEDAPPLFALPESCWSVSLGERLMGLAWSARPVNYGEGEGLLLQAKGQATVPSPDFKLKISGAAAGLAAIFYDFGAACPPLALHGAPILLPLAPGWGLVGPFPIGGDLLLPAALPGPAILPDGVTIHLQAVAQGASGGTRTSNGLAFTTCRP
jgi:hypothetical protein